MNIKNGKTKKNINYNCKCYKMNLPKQFIEELKNDKTVTVTLQNLVTDNDKLTVELILNKNVE